MHSGSITRMSQTNAKDCYEAKAFTVRANPVWGVMQGFRGRSTSEKHLLSEAELGRNKLCHFELK